MMIMNVIIRQEINYDYNIVENVIERAFKNVEISDHTEHLLVSRLRKGSEFIPKLSLVAEIDGKIVGHILFTKIKVDNGKSQFQTLTLAPLSVSPKYQGKGIGGKLIDKGLKIARKLGYKSVILVGHEKYYPKFGFKPASQWGIKSPFEVPDKAFMAIELEVDSLNSVQGTVVYSKEFFEE